MKRLILILVLAVFSPIAVDAQSDTTDVDEDDFTPNFASWSVLTDVEVAAGSVGMYNVAVIGGVNFANHHLYYGCGFVGSYAYRGERSHDNVVTSEKGADKVVTVVDEVGIDKAFFGIAMDLRYDVLPGKMLSPLFQFRIAKLLSERSTSYKSATVGLAYRIRDTRHTLSLAAGVYRFDYNIGARLMDYSTMTVVNIGLKF